MPSIDFRTGNGAAWLDLLATRRGRYRSRSDDDLADSAALDSWLARFATAPARRSGADDLETARQLREALHGLAVATLRGDPPRRADVTTVNRVLAVDAPVRLRTRGGQLAAERPADAVQALADLAREAVRTLTGPDREHLHACGDDTCSGIFLDRAGRRRWCSDERCGNRMRVRAHRTRQAG